MRLLASEILGPAATSLQLDQAHGFYCSNYVQRMVEKVNWMKAARPSWQRF